MDSSISVFTLKRIKEIKSREKENNKKKKESDKIYDKSSSCKTEAINFKPMCSLALELRL